MVKPRGVRVFPILNSSSLCCFYVAWEAYHLSSEDLYFNETHHLLACWMYSFAHRVAFLFFCPVGSPRFDWPDRTPWWARREGWQGSARTPRFSWYQGRWCKLTDDYIPMLVFEAFFPSTSCHFSLLCPSTEGTVTYWWLKKVQQSGSLHSTYPQRAHVVCFSSWQTGIVIHTAKIKTFGESV